MQGDHATALPPNMDFVFDILNQRGIHVAGKTLQRHTHQGWMSSIFKVDSSAGPLVIHITDLVEEHHKNKVWEKFSGLARISADHQEISAPAIYFSGLIDNKFVLVQRFLDGTPAGRRTLHQGVIADEWSVDRAVIIKKILVALTNVHAITLHGFGWPLPSGETVQGSYPTWKDSLMKESPRWLESIRGADERLQCHSIDGLADLIKSIINRIDYARPSVLVHGDAINPGNILVAKDGSIALLDWEWSIAADPAWEFCDLGWWPIVDSDKNDLDSEMVARARLYVPLWLLWGVHMHARDINPEVYLALRKLLINRLG